jgi:hypothetical protein
VNASERGEATDTTEEAPDTLHSVPAQSKLHSGTGAVQQRPVACTLTFISLASFGSFHTWFSFPVVIISPLVKYSQTQRSFESGRPDYSDAWTGHHHCTFTIDSFVHEHLYFHQYQPAKPMKHASVSLITVSHM